jgi:hypothetical protein
MSKVKSISTNSAFWIFFLVMLFLFVTNILICVVDIKKILGNMKIKGLNKDGLETSCSTKSQIKISVININEKSDTQCIINKTNNVFYQLNKKPKILINNTSHNNINNNLYQSKEIGSTITNNSNSSLQRWSIQLNSFSQALKDNITLHPILAITPFHHSITSPMMINVHINVFSFLTMFFYSAVYLSENVIENRIYVSYSDRNKFIYPLKYHFGRIIAVILTSMMFTLLLRIISLVRYEQRKKLINIISVNKTEIEKTERVEKFNNEQNILLRRFLTCIICWGFLLLYAIYMYIRTSAIKKYT